MSNYDEDLVRGMASLVVSEVFGPTVSGEGRSLGQRCGFVRLMGCNLHCTWCDTPYTWDARRYNLREQGARMAWAEIVNRIVAMDVDLVVVSGGEPLLHQDKAAWAIMLNAFTGHGIRVEVETNGTVIPNEVSCRGVHRFTVSPKLDHAGDPEAARIVPDAIREHVRQGSDFKFVCSTPEHVAQVARLAKDLEIPQYAVWIMPLGSEVQEMSYSLAMITDAAIVAGFNVTTRLHIQVWGNARGH